MNDDLQLETDPRPGVEVGHRTSLLRWLTELVVMVAIAFALASAVRVYVVQPYVIPTGSMVPTIEIGERVLANKFVFRFTEPRQGDIVVFDNPIGEKKPFIKRVIAVGGQTVDIKDNAVYVDGVQMDEPYTHGKPSVPGDITLPVTVPQGSVWLMGDNRTGSSDARYFGPRPVSTIRGKAFARIWPLNRIAGL